VIVFFPQTLTPTLQVGGEQASIPLFDVRRGTAFEEGDEGVEGLARVAEGVVKGVPVLAVFAIVIGNDVIEEVGEAEFGVGAAGAAFDIFQILEREFTLVATGAAEELVAHHVGNELFEIEIAAGGCKKNDFFGGKRREESRQPPKMRY